MSDLLDRYAAVAGRESVDQLCQLAAPLKHITITHVSATPLGGGVAEILHSMVPLTEALGITTKWQIINGSAEFYQCTKDFHNSLQGNHTSISSAQLKVYETINEANAETLRHNLETSDVVIIHDPQPMAMITHFPERKNKWIWRCHIDASRPYWPVWKYLSGFAKQYDASIFSLVDFTHPLPHPMFLVPPSIDPLSEKNRDLEQEEIDKIRPLFGIDPERPLVLQVSRFDRFKDPIGVIEAFRLARKFNPGIQLALAGSGAQDDPEGEVVLGEVKRAAGNNPDIHILLLPPDAHRLINALQRSADIIMQKSIKEGFGLTVTEGLWKGKPLIGGNVGGIRLQVIHKETGFIVNTPEGAAYRIRHLLQHRQIAEEVGAAGKEYIRKNFLITRHLRDYLSLIYSLLFESNDQIELPTVRP